MSSILCCGSIALDTTRTPFRAAHRVLGGAASFFAYSASFFSPVKVVSVVGDDFPDAHWQALASREAIDLSGVKRAGGEKTFFFDSSFSYDLYARTTNKIELNSLATFTPEVPPEARKCELAYLATMPPQKQAQVLAQAEDCKLSFMDTIEYYIENEREELLSAMKQVDGMVLNDIEARLLTKESSLLKAGKKVWELGPKIVVIKKGEHGSMLFFGGAVYPLPAFPLEEITDPTGAGDSFAGGLVGFLASKNATRETLSAELLRTATAYATVMGSFAVEDFSLDALRRTSREDVEARFEQYRGLMRV